MIEIAKVNYPLSGFGSEGREARCLHPFIGSGKERHQIVFGKGAAVRSVERVLAPWGSLWGAVANRPQTDLGE